MLHDYCCCPAVSSPAAEFKIQAAAAPPAAIVCSLEECEARLYIWIRQKATQPDASPAAAQMASYYHHVLCPGYELGNMERRK